MSKKKQRPTKSLNSVHKSTTQSQRVIIVIVSSKNENNNKKICKWLFQIIISEAIIAFLKLSIEIVKSFLP